MVREGTGRICKQEGRQKDQEGGRKRISLYYPVS
jgi:hypothetical protein